MSIVAKLRSALFSDVFAERSGALFYKMYLAGECIGTGEYINVRISIDLSVIAKISKVS
jgi:hypothetical protein